MGAELKLTMDLSGLREFTAEVESGLGEVVRAAGNEIIIHAQASMTGPKSGRVYERGERQVSFTTRAGRAVSFLAGKGKKTKSHRASAPGEAPAMDEGNLSGGMKFQPTGRLSGVVEVPAKYAAALEFGTEDGKIAPRPFLAPAVEAVRPTFEAAAAAVIRRAAQ